MKVLLVEDDLTTVDSIQLCFEVSDPDSILTSTGSGIEALQKLKNETFDVLILDLGLPDIDGMEVLEQLRSFSQLPVIVLSARHSLDVINRALELGANDYITKPFDYRLLINRLDSLNTRSL